MIGCLPTQALAFLAVFVYATHATHAIAFEWKPGMRDKETEMSAAVWVHIAREGLYTRSVSCDSASAWLIVIV